MLTRRRFLGSTAAAACGIAGASATRAFGQQAKPAEYTLKWGHSMQLSHPLTIRGMEAADKIRQESGGRVDIKVFPDSQLGGDTDMASQVRSGVLEMYTPAATSFAPLVPVVGIVNTAFAFKDSRQGWQAMDGDLGALIRQGFGRINLHVFDRMWENGFRQITSATKPINAPDDLKGFKIRVPISPMLLSLFKSLGAAPTSMNVSELYSALQTHIVDGQENPLSVIATRNFNEVQRYCALTNHSWDTWIQVMNMNVWKKLPADLQEIISRNMNAAALLQREDIQKLDLTLRASLEGKGMIFNSPDRAPFREALKKAGYYAEWQKVYGDVAWKALESAVGNLT
ncbi:TRAP transporter substrate-binding protein [Xanthobacter sp. KR7-225]|uniref:TRAP transporter substrate-binding protein n=1 Tax=Xanthobacter sp. KR7-225 TaxID=3156613 RepID=UPI0032B5720C